MTPPGPGAGGLDQAVLLEQVSWIRRLARELVSDRDLAEDLVQETCVAALESAPRESGKLRRWLAEVLRNALRQHARAQGRRRVREDLYARAEETRAEVREDAQPTDRLVERVALQRQLVGAVLELDEPARTTVLLRFFEELPPREIARRTGVPLATVQSRLSRSLARLRERLDGEQRAWAAILLGALPRTEVLGTPTLLTLFMNTKLAAVALATMLAAGALVWWSADETPSRASSAPLALAGASDLAAPPEGEAGASGAFPPQVAEREPTAVVERPVPAPSAAPAERAPWTIRLRVLDAEGVPMAGIAVRADESAAVLGTSASGGWCVFDTRADRLVLSAADPRWVTIHHGSPTRAGSVDPVLVLAPAITVSGDVRDESGRSLSGANVHFRLPEGFSTRFEVPLEATREGAWRADTDPDGAFSFARLPAVAGSTLSSVVAGYERASIEAPLVSSRDLELVLQRPKMPLSGVLRGEVRDLTGAGVSGARVGVGLASVVSDEQGRFEVPLARAVTAEVITAIKAGFLPARMERPEEPRAGASGWPDSVVLVLAGPALSIRGVVLDHEEKPVSGARVWVHDPTPAAPIGMMPTFLEPLMAGASIPTTALESESNLPKEDGDRFFDWYTNVREPNALWHWVLSDATGHFELGGLDQRRYRLDVLRPGGLEVITSESLQAGDSSAVVRLGAPELFEHVNGRVLSEDGAPIAGVQVMLYRPVIDARARIFGGNSQVVIVEPSTAVTTDAAGAFVFDNVPEHGAVLNVRGDDIVPTKADVTGATLDIEVEVRCHLEVVLREAFERFDAIGAADADGKGLDILELTEGSTNAWTSVPLVQGRSGVVSVSARARELQLLKNGQVVERRALTLVAGEVNRIEL